MGVVVSVYLAKIHLTEQLNIRQVLLENQHSELISAIEQQLEQAESLAHNNTTLLEKQAFEVKKRFKYFPALADLSRRDKQEASSGFFPADVPFTAFFASLFNNSIRVFDSIAGYNKGISLAFTFESKDGFIRFSDPEAASRIDANRNVSLLVEDAKTNAFTSKWGQPKYDNIKKQWQFSYQMPVYVKDEFMGLTTSTLSLANLSETLFSNIDQPAYLKTIVIGPNRHLLFDNFSIFSTEVLFEIDDALSKLSRNITTHAPLLAEYKRFKNDSDSKFINIENELFLITPVKKIAGIAISHIGTEQKFTQLPINTYLFILLGTLVLGLTLVLFIYRLLNRRIFGPLARLKGGVDVYDYRKPANLMNAPIEIEGLTQSLNQTLNEHSSTLNTLEQQVMEKQKHQVSAALLSNAIKYSDTAIAILTSQYDIFYANSKFYRLIGFDEKTALGKPIRSIFDKKMAWLVDGALERLALDESWQGELVLSNNDGSTCWVSQTFSPMKETINGERCFVSASHDISSIKKNQQEMETLAYHDPLTGLVNRAYFKSQLSKSFEMTKRGHYQFALLYFDLDQFKRINDTLGHEAGDELLTFIGNRLTERLRTEDTVARLGGDEFAVIVGGVSGVEDTSNIAQSLLDIIKQPLALSTGEVIISASIGITLAPNDSDTIDSLLRNADLAMYKAKDAGRNTYYFFNPELDQAAKEYVLIEAQLREAIKQKQFELYYQPQINISSGDIFGFEALIRWRHPKKGIISPIVFIPVAEQTGLIVEIGEMVIEQACHFIKRINSRFESQYTIAVNLSARQFKDQNIIKLIRESIVSARISPADLDLEVTETMLMGDIDEAIKHMNALKELGVQLSIDDFGTGYSSLSYLKRFPVDTLKVDRAFIKDIPFDKDDMAISAAIIAMAHKLNLSVIAEGVETLEQIAFLSENDCQIGQGFHYSKPLPEVELIPFIEQNRQS